MTPPVAARAPSPTVVAPGAPTPPQAPKQPAPRAAPSGPTDGFTLTGPSAFASGMTPMTPADAARAGAAAMTNEQMLQLGDTPAGAAALTGMANTMKQGPMTPERQQQLDRIAAATFQPAGGLKIDGNAADTKTYLQTVRRTMMESPSFAKTMKEINADSKHPVNVKLERNSGTRLDSFANQTLDLSDLEKLPAKPTPGRPEETTQGGVLAHMMREQQEKAHQTGPKDRAPAHSSAIESENAYRKDIGQKSMRLMPPHDESVLPTPTGLFITTHYDDGHHEALMFDNNGNLNGSVGFSGAPAWHWPETL